MTTHTDSNNHTNVSTNINVDTDIKASVNTNSNADIADINTVIDNLDNLAQRHQVNGKHLLITGATGGLGHEAVEWALKWGYQVTALGRNQSILQQLRQLGCQTVAMDLGLVSIDNPQSQTLTKILSSVDVIWNCSARSAPWGQYDDFYRDNVKATQYLVQLAGQCGVARFVHISTPGLYFDYQHHKNVSEQYQAKHYANHYVATKVQAEQVIQQAVAQYPNTSFVILRPRAIFGKYDQVLLPRLLKVLQSRRYLPLPRGGQAVMDFTHAINVTHAMQLASTIAVRTITNKDIKNKDIQRENLANTTPTAPVFNISNQEPMALQALITQMFTHQLGIPVRIKSLPYAILDKVAIGLEAWANISGVEPMFTRYSMGVLNFDLTLDNQQAQTQLGYYPLLSMTQAVQLTAQHWRAKLAN